MPKLDPIYVDESLSQGYLPDALRREGLEVYKVTDKFERGVTDPEWLERAGREGWVVLTKDKAIRRRPNERLALLNSGVRAFVLTAGAMTGPDQAALFVRLLPKIADYVARFPGPFVVKIAKDGTCEMIDATATPSTAASPDTPSDTLTRGRRWTATDNPDENGGLS